jgi:hypothetical protein
MIKKSPLASKDDGRTPAARVGSACRKCSHRRRRGSLLAEATMSSVILVVVMAVTVKVLGWAAHERRGLERRERAVLEVASLIERITARPYDFVTPELAGEFTAAARNTRTLPDSDLKIDIAETHPGAGRSAKRIAIELRWREPSGEWAAPVRLTSWIERRRPSR